MPCAATRSGLQARRAPIAARPPPHPPSLAVPGLLLKSGAEGVEGLALADGRAAAFKIDDGDGARRARTAVTVALLHTLGADDGPGADRATLDDLASPEVLGGGRKVGEVRAVLSFKGL
jgi:L-asparaginase II